MTFIAPHYRKARKKAVLPFFRKDHFLVRTPGWLKSLYPRCLWDMPEKEKRLYLSFDDGPHPEITLFVLDLLKKYQARATFFCIGENVNRYPDIYRRILEEGHATGNHTQHHINGWTSEDAVYLEDIQLAAGPIHSRLFRPPYGRISRSQLRQLLKMRAPDGQTFQVVMWNILAGDWVQELSPEKCLERISRKIADGDIIVFHDSEKAWDRMSYCLPRILEHYSTKGYRFEVIR